jgi:hypothetical protein
MLCSLVFSQMPLNMCHFPVCCCTDPFLWGCIFKRAGFCSSKEPGVGSRVYIQTCLPVALDEDWRLIATMPMLCTHKVEDLCNWIFDELLMLLQ